MEQNKTIRVGTRGSELALIQTEMVIEALRREHPEYEYEQVILRTQGDRQLDRAISSFGGKAVFVEEFEEALRQGQIDMAVHSAKDMPNPCGEGLCIGGVLARACVQDVLIYPRGRQFDEASEFVIGTGSLRRQVQILEKYPHAHCEGLRGNIGTRLRKLREGQYDAIILAAAGIGRQGLDRDPDLVYQYLDTWEMVPAAGQAIIAVETRQEESAELAEDISDETARMALDWERQVLSWKEAGCHEAFGVCCEPVDGHWRMRMMEVQDGKVVREERVWSI